ncbi:hypothetical protein AB0J82_15345 [Asanoa sp. NPDC049518]|uniref:hypothetical protein n=1 Tax=unclassified Asanoa TaxID=2685164 RepID=UPI003430E003
MIRANLLHLDDRAQFQAWISELREKGEVHSNALMEEVFRIAIRQMIVGPQQIAEIPAFVEELQSLASDHIRPKETELLIRHALGQGVSVEYIDPKVANLMMSLTLMRLASIVRMTGGDAEGFVNSAIVKAEAALEEKGVSQAGLDN